MTSIIAPWAAAANLAAKANTSLNRASAMLRSDVPRPFTPGQDGGFDVPTAPEGGLIPPYMHNNAAMRLAGGAVQDIETALNISQHLSHGVRTAFTGARDAAKAGVDMLMNPTYTPADGLKVPQRFDAASMWLGLASSLLAMEHGMQDVIAPGDPGSPITIEPIKIQLPHPTSPIQ